MAQPIALQLYSVRQEMELDPLGTLRRVAEIGYQAVEFAGYGNVPVGEIRETLDGLGVRAVAAHVPLRDFEERLPAALDELRVLGCGHAVLASVPGEWRGVERAAALADRLNGWGAVCRDAGIRLNYHNHDFEFAPAAGATMHDVLIAETDPALVAFEVDTGWVEFTKTDAAAVLRRLTGRVPLVHIKDIAAGTPYADRPVGEGVIAWEPILDAALAAGVEWYIVEQDDPAQPLPDAATSLAHLRRLLAGR